MFPRVARYLGLGAVPNFGEHLIPLLLRCLVVATKVGATLAETKGSKEMGRKAKLKGLKWTHIHSLSSPLIFLAQELSNPADERETMGKKK